MQSWLMELWLENHNKKDWPDLSICQPEDAFHVTKEDDHPSREDITKMCSDGFFTEHEYQYVPIHLYSEIPVGEYKSSNTLDDEYTPMRIESAVAARGLNSTDVRGTNCPFPSERSTGENGTRAYENLNKPLGMAAEETYATIRPACTNDLTNKEIKAKKPPLPAPRSLHSAVKDTNVPCKTKVDGGCEMNERKFSRPPPQIPLTSDFTQKDVRATRPPLPAPRTPRATGVEQDDTKGVENHIAPLKMENEEPHVTI